MKTKNYRHKRHNGKCKCKRTQRRTRAHRGGNLFNGSNYSSSIMCLAGSSKIPCTAFSTA